MSNYELGKEAAFVDLVQMVDGHGGGFDDCLDAVNLTLNAELDKTASESDVDYQLGIESMCHEFLKTANQLFAEYDCSDCSQNEFAQIVLEKIAEEESEEIEKSEKRTMRDRARAFGSAAKGHLGAHKGKYGTGAALAAGGYLYNKRRKSGQAGEGADLSKNASLALEILQEEGLI